MNSLPIAACAALLILAAADFGSARTLQQTGPLPTLDGTIGNIVLPGGQGGVKLTPAPAPAPAYSPATAPSAGASRKLQQAPVLRALGLAPVPAPAPAPKLAPAGGRSLLQSSVAPVPAPAPSPKYAPKTAPSSGRKLQQATGALDVTNAVGSILPLYTPALAPGPAPALAPVSAVSGLLLPGSGTLIPGNPGRKMQQVSSVVDAIVGGATRLLTPAPAPAPHKAPASAPSAV